MTTRISLIERGEWSRQLVGEYGDCAMRLAGVTRRHAAATAETLDAAAAAADAADAVAQVRVAG
jgi:hypothetical protein